MPKSKHRPEHNDKTRARRQKRTEMTNRKKKFMEKLREAYAKKRLETQLQTQETETDESGESTE